MYAKHLILKQEAKIKKKLENGKMCFWEKEGDLTQSYDETPYTNRKFEKPKDNTCAQTPPKTSITQPLQTDLGRSVGVKTVIQLVWLNRFTGTQPSQ